MEDDLQYKIRNTEDFCCLKRYNYSITALREKYKEEVIPPKVVAAALKMTEEEVKLQYDRVVRKLQAMMKPQPEDADM